MSFFTPKVETGVSTGDNTPGRSASRSPRQVLPLVLGRGRVAVQWVTPVLKWNPVAGKTSQTWFANIYGWIACGPVDEIVQILVNDKPYYGVFAFRDQNPGDYFDVTIPHAEPFPSEKFRFFWGLENAANYTAYLQGLVGPGCPGMAGKSHPSYLGVFAVAAENLLAGTTMDGKSPPLPKVEIEFHRRSVAAYDFGYVPHGTHPVGIIKDVLTLPRGGRGLPGGLFDDAHWTARMQRLMDVGISTMKGTDLFLSSVLAEPKEADEIVADILSYLDGWLVERNGKLEIDWSPNDGSSLVEAGLRVITEHELAEDEVDEDPGTLEGIPSQMIVTGLDWTADPPLSEASESAPVPFVKRLVNDSREPETVNRPGFTTRAQLKSYATMLAACRANPDAQYTVPVLRQYAVQLDGVTPIRPGDLFVLNLASNGGRRIVLRVTERSSDDPVKVVFKCQRERGTFPKPAQPVLDPRIDTSRPAPADLARFCLAQLPPDLADNDSPAVVALAERPNAEAVALQVDMSPNNVWPGQMLDNGIQRWAVCAINRTVLAPGYGDTVVTVDTVGADWLRLRSQSTLEQGDDQLVLYGGQEWFSVGTITPFGGGSYSLALKRARLGGLPAALAYGAPLYLILRSDLIALRHAEFGNIELAGSYNAGVATKYFKLRPIGAGGLAGNYSAAVALTLRDPTPEAPTGLTAQVGTGKLVDLRWNPVADSLINEYRVYRSTGPAYADEALIGEVGGTRFIDTRVTTGVAYRYRVSAITTDETESPKSIAVDAVPTLIGPGAVDSTKPAKPAAPTASVPENKGTYLTGDATVLSYLTIMIASLTADSVGQNVLYRRSGTGNWLQAAQLFNAGVATIRVDDLSPGINYEFAVQSFSFSGASSDVSDVLSYTAPTRTTAPTWAANFVLTPGNSSNYRGGIVTEGGTRVMACQIDYSTCFDPDFSHFEIYLGMLGLSEAQVSANWAGIPLTTLDTRIIQPIATTTPVALYVRAVNRSQVKTAWAATASLVGYMGYPSGDMVNQSANAITTTGIATGNGASVRRVLCRYQVTAVVTLAGGAPAEDVGIDISGRGFSTKPDTAAVEVASSNDVGCYYNWDNGSNSSSSAWIKFHTFDGSNLVGGNYRVSIEFIEYD